MIKFCLEDDYKTSQVALAKQNPKIYALLKAWSLHEHLVSST